MRGSVRDRLAQRIFRDALMNSRASAPELLFGRSGRQLHPCSGYLVLSSGGSDRGFGERFEGAGVGVDSLFTFGWD